VPYQRFSSEGGEACPGHVSHCSNISTIMIPENPLKVNTLGAVFAKIIRKKDKK
jgi:hypothetical protein